MIAYKGFDKDLGAPMGRRNKFVYEPGKTYEETEAKCANNGFHCAENPLCAMSYYGKMTDRYFIVDAAGDINQDGAGSRISCTKITLVKELTRIQMAVLACEYMRKYPNRDIESSFCTRDEGHCRRFGDFVITRGTHPVASGVKGSYLFLLQEAKKQIKDIYIIAVDNNSFIENKKYYIRGGKICEKKS